MIPWPWPAPVDDEGAAHLTFGTKVPSIGLPSTSGEMIDLSARSGRSIVFIYTWTGRPGLSNPQRWDDIPGAHGSTPELEGIRNLASSFESLDTAVFGVSTQSSEWQQEFAERLKLNYPLLSDENLAFADALRLPRFVTGGDTYLRRLTLSLVDGVVDWAFYPVHPPDTHARDVLAWLTDHVGYALEGRINPHMTVPR